MSNFDAVKFRKVRAMMDGGATEGERTAARGRAEAIAAKVGWDLHTAIQFDDAQRRRAGDTTGRTSTTQTWEEYWAKGQAEREARFREAERQHGSSEKAFAETDRERRLRLALKSLAVRSKYSNSSKSYISGFGTWTVGAPDVDVLAALERAYPLPTNLPGAMAEWQEWDDLFELRFAYDRDYDIPIHVRCRVDALASILDTMPARSWSDFDIRMQWRRRGIERDRWHDINDDIAAHDRLAADLAFLRSMETPPSTMDSNPRRTNAEKRQAVLSILDTHPELSDREIARRAGVSPQTVNNWRRRRYAT
ncbi:MAG: winged helix-turn-helix domain-containing protein [Devosia sp.]|nr:winged helix-turn-helix domain-containing protein [Devosia sp.]